MFKKITLEDIIRIPPDTFGGSLKKAGLSQVKTKYVGVVSSTLGYIIAVIDIKVNPTGKIIHGDGAVYHKAKFSILTFLPKLQEVIEGEVVEIADFGAFVRLGPIDALLHVSQLMDDFISYDEKQGMLAGRETSRRLTSGDRIRVRITAVSIGKTGSSGKIGVTARQSGLGKIEWIKKEFQVPEKDKPIKKEKSKKDEKK